MAPRKEHKLRMRRLTEGHRSAVTGKELTLIIVAILAVGLAGYATYDSNNAFGLLQTAPEENTVEKPLPNVQTDFEEEAFSAEGFTNRVQSRVLPNQEPTGAAVYDPTEPPGVVSFNGYRMKTGNGIVVYWEKPEFVQAVNVYKREVTPAELYDPFTQQERVDLSFVGDELLAFAEGNMYVDEDVQEGAQYQYTIETVNEVDGRKYYGENIQGVLIHAEDVVRPQDPTNVVVTSSFDENSEIQHGALKVEWENPPDEDVERIEIYRSGSFTSRGSIIAYYEKDGDDYAFVEYVTIDNQREEAEPVAVGEESITSYTDTDVEPNQNYYYVVIAVDEAGNASSGKFQSPAPGNRNPFDPVDLRQYQYGEETPFQ